MSLTDEERRILMELEFEKATKIFSQVDSLIGLKYWDNIANRLYYSLFHAVSALLIRDGHEVNTHRGTVASFGQYYIKTKVLPLEDGKLYSQLQSIREKSDYNCTYDATEAEILPRVEQTRSLINRIGKMLSVGDA